MRILVYVKPNSKEDSLEKISEKEYKAQIKAPPEKNKANIGLIKIISKEFKVSADKVKIKSPASRKKLVEILT